MPLYEYKCEDCDVRFEALRGMSQSDWPIACPQCGQEHTHRAMSLFATQGSGGTPTGSRGASCSACSGGSCATCGA